MTTDNQGGGALLLGVVAFFYGKQIYYDILYPGPGFPYRVQPIELLFWGVLGLFGGAALGVIASRIGRSGWLPAGASALFMGLLLADAYSWYSTRGEALPMGAAIVGVVVIAILGERTWRQIGYTALLLIPGTIAGYLLVSAPEVAQRFFRL